MSAYHNGIVCFSSLCGIYILPNCKRYIIIKVAYIIHLTVHKTREIEMFTKTIYNVIIDLSDVLKKKNKQIQSLRVVPRNRH